MCKTGNIPKSPPFSRMVALHALLIKRGPPKGVKYEQAKKVIKKFRG